MRAEVIRPFKIRGELMPIGTMLDIRDEDYPRLYLKVVPIEPATADVMEAEYLTLLARYWTIDSDPTATMDEVRQLVQRLDALYRELARQGKTMLVRI